MENNLKVGMKLKCIKQHSNGLVIQGKEYTLRGMMYICKHYPLAFLVNNEPTTKGTTMCPHCKTDSGGQWVCSSRFSVPEIAEEEETKTEYKIVEIDKSLKEKRKEVIHFN